MGSAGDGSARDRSARGGSARGGSAAGANRNRAPGGVRGPATPAPAARPRLDAIDLRILATLQREGRITKLALADRVGLSPSPCWERLRRLEQAGIVAGYHARIAHRLLGPVTTVFAEITLASHRQADFDRFEAAIAEIPEVVECWAVGGGLDYLLKVITRDIDAYQRLIDGLLADGVGIDRYFTYIVTKPVKESPGLPVGRLVADMAEEDAQ